MTESIEMVQLTLWTEANKVIPTRNGKLRRYINSYLRLVNLVTRDPKRKAILRWKGNQCAVFVSNNYGHIKVKVDE